MISPDLDETMMARALTIGRRGLGDVWPNPSVGCVIVNDGRIVGRGRTGQGGRPHAETVALSQAGAAAKGATAYVTLEPCSHIGQTPPCADALINAGVSRVVAALGDPNPQVDGAGFARLRDAGIEVRTGVLEAQAKEDHQGFLSSVNLGRPHVTLKLAASLDGRIATASGESRWITGPQARTAVHAMRARHDAVLIGGGTARADDPELTVRGQGNRRDPVRIVATRHLDLPFNGKLATTANQTPLWLLHGAGIETDHWAGLGAKTIEIATGPDRQLSPVSIMTTLAEHGLTRVFCEGGGALAASLLMAGLVDRLVVFHAGLGLGAEGTPGIGALGLETLSSAPRFDLLETKPVGPDLMSVWAPRR